MAHSEAVQYLFVSGPTSKKPHLHGLDAYPEHITKSLGHHFTRKGEGDKHKVDKQPSAKKPGASGHATRELFSWASRTTGARSPTITDPRLKRAAASMVNPSFGNRRRDTLEVERDLSGFRRLAFSRHDNEVMGVSSDCYKDEDYEAHEETDQPPNMLGSASSATSALGDSQTSSQFQQGRRASDLARARQSFARSQPSTANG